MRLSRRREGSKKLWRSLWISTLIAFSKMQSRNRKKAVGKFFLPQSGKPPNHGVQATVVPLRSTTAPDAWRYAAENWNCCCLTRSPLRSRETAPSSCFVRSVLSTTWFPERHPALQTAHKYQLRNVIHARECELLHHGKDWS